MPVLGRNALAALACPDVVEGSFDDMSHPVTVETGQIIERGRCGAGESPGAVVEHATGYPRRMTTRELENAIREGAPIERGVIYLDGPPRENLIFDNHCNYSSTECEGIRLYRAVDSQEG